VNPLRLFDEIQELVARGFNCKNLIISYHTSLIMPYHMLLDELEENRRAAKDSRGMIGTTKRGIGPTFSDKMARTGPKVGDLRNPARFRERVRYACEEKNALIEHLYNAPPVDPDAISDQYLEVGDKLRKYIGDSTRAILDGLDDGKRILFEGAQGTLLDIDYGLSYPFLTSSHPVSGGACLGTGLAPNRIDRIYGVVKAYISRVGEGIFPTELHDDLGVQIRNRGNEYGTATGRPRRVGWLDLVLLKYAADINGLTDIVLTKVDILDELPEINVCVAYKMNGKKVFKLPSDPDALENIEPVYETFPGWLLNTDELATGDMLPENLMEFISFISKFVNVPITLLGVGTRRRQMVELG
jgi:adenylosuccinate synthase